jgi:hypothetical protein
VRSTQLDRGDLRDRGDHKYCGKQSSDQMEKRPFRHPNDTEKWCKIHDTSSHDLEDATTNSVITTEAPMS